MTRHRSCPRDVVQRFALVVALATPVWAGESFRFELDEVRRDAPKRVLEIRNAHGVVRLMPSIDGRIRAGGVKLIRAANRERAERLAEKVRLLVHEGRDVLQIEVEVPERDRGRGFLHGLLGRREEIEVELGVHTPAGCRLLVSTMTARVEGRGLLGPLEVETLSGDVDFHDLRDHVSVSTATGDLRIQNTAGNVRVESSSGDVRLGRIEGSIDVDTASGDVDASDIDGGAVIQTLSGDLRIWRCSGALRFSTASGSARIENVKGHVQAQSASGDLDLECPLLPNTDYDFETASGDIGVTVQGRHPFRVEAFTARGDLAARLPGLFCETRTERDLVGRVGRGGANLRIRSASGSIRLWAGEAQEPLR